MARDEEPEGVPAGAAEEGAGERRPSPPGKGLTAVLALVTANLGLGVVGHVGWFWWIRSMTGKWIDGVG